MMYQNFLRNLRKNKNRPFDNFEKKFIIIKNRYAFLTPARAPYVKDHLLILPKRHLLTLGELKEKEKKAIFDLIMEGIKILEKKYPAVQMEYKEGDLLSARKSIPHLHFHLIPRRKKNKESKEKRIFLSEKELIREVRRIKKF